jgi:hypothetical protein
MVLKIDPHNTYIEKNSYEYKNKSARRGTQFVPIGMPTTCWNSVPPKEANMLSMRNSSILKLFTRVVAYITCGFWKTVKIFWITLNQDLSLRYPPSKLLIFQLYIPPYTVSLQRRQICYQWGTPAYWSLVPRSSMFYLFEFCLKNMWNCSLTPSRFIFILMRVGVSSKACKR